MSEHKQNNILLLFDPGREGVDSVTERIRSKLAEVDSISLQERDLRKVDKEYLAKVNCNLIIVLGGDGTLLGVVRNLGNNQKPILGVNLGKLGYLAEFDTSNIDHAIDDIKNQQLIISKRLILETRVENGSSEFSSFAVNDVVIQAGPPFRMIRMTVYVDDIEMTSMEGDGIIVSSTTGSTGHNISAGGPVVDHCLDAIVLTPICPHSLTHRPLVLSGNAKVAIKVDRVNPQSALIVDGQVTKDLTGMETILVWSAKQHFQLVHNSRHSRWYTLRTKLNWGIDPRK